MTKNLTLLFVFATTFLFFSVSEIEAYSPPIGIPDPGAANYDWGDNHPIDSVAPDTATECPAWPSGETTNCYYIDNTDPNATDSGNTYGYPGRPRMTIPAAYSAGAYAEIHGGPYTAETSITFSGTEAEPIWFRGTPGDMPDIESRFLLHDAKYVFIEYLDINSITGNAVSFLGLDANHVCFRNNAVHDLLWPGNNTSGIGATPTQDGNFHTFVFYNNNFSDIGNWEAADDQDFHAINPTLWGRHPDTTLNHFWVLSNSGYHISGNLVQFNGDQRDAMAGDNEDPIRLVTNSNQQNLHHLYVGNNTHHHSRQTLASLKFSTDSVVSQNTVYSNYSQASAGATGQVYQEGASWAWIIFNDFHDADWGVRQSNTNFSTPIQDALLGVPSESTLDMHVFIIGNLIKHTYNTQDNSYIFPFPRNHRYKTTQAVCSEAGFYKRWIVDNTIRDTGGGFNFGGNVYSDTRMSGNVISGVQGIDNDGLPDFHVRVGETGGEASIDYTFFQPRADNGTTTFSWAGLPTTIYTSLQSFKDASGQCQNCWEGDPGFVDADNYDLHPRSDSSLLGKGARNEAYDIFESRYGLSIAYDFDGNPRPSSGPWTIGAYEYAEAGTDTIAPGSPSGLLVQ